MILLFMYLAYVFVVATGIYKLMHAVGVLPK
jgi:hypothetical protein